MQSVRKGYIAPKVTEQSQRPQSSATLVRKKQRFADTLTILTQKSVSPLLKQFIEAQSRFDAGKFTESQILFSEFAENIAQDDSLHYEAQFMIAECKIALAEYDSATDLLQSALRNESLPIAVHERSLLRLAQLYCAQGNLEKATKHFAEFQREYPKSQFMAMANCDTVKTR